MSKKIYICRCEEITVEEVEQAIADGATTIDGIKKRTNAGMGLCQGRTCRRLITNLLRGTVKIEDIYPSKVRYPVRAALVEEFLGED